MKNKAKNFGSKKNKKSLFQCVATTLALSCSAAACSADDKNAANSLNQVGTEVMSSLDLFTGWNRIINSSEGGAGVSLPKEVRALSSKQAYELMIAKFGNRNVIVDGVNIKVTAAQLKSGREYFAALDKKYGSFGAYVDSLRTVRGSMSAAEVKALIKMSSGERTGLSLGEEDTSKLDCSGIDFAKKGLEYGSYFGKAMSYVCMVTVLVGPAGPAGCGAAFSIFNWTIDGLSKGFTGAQILGKCSKAPEGVDWTDPKNRGAMQDEVPTVGASDGAVPNGNPNRLGKPVTTKKS